MSAKTDRTIASLSAEVQALRLRLSNKVAQIDLLLQQIEEIKTALAYAGLEIHYTTSPTTEDNNGRQQS